MRATAPLISRVSPRLASRALAALFTTPLRHTPPPRERAWLADASQGSVTMPDGRQLPIHMWGEGPVILLVHGWAGRGSQMGVFAAPLVEAGFRVVAFDQPAHGGAGGRRSAVPDFAVAIQAVAGMFGPVRGVIAHSLGAAATTLAVAQGMRAERLVYIAPPEDLPGYLTRTGRQLGFSDAVTTAARERLERRYGIPFEQARGAALAPQRDTPLLIIHDEEDREVPFHEGARIAALWPGARMMPVRELGHRRIVRAPQTIDAALAFLTATTGAERAAS